MDKFSTLPNHIVDIIFHLLPIVESARTSILSKQWRYKWHATDSLVFDQVFLDNLMSNRSALKESNSQNWLLPRDLRIILTILQMHKGSINKFVVTCPLNNSRRVFGAIAKILTIKDVQHLQLPTIIMGSSMLPKHIFSCNTLQTLILGSCIFKVPLLFKGFPNLINLEFHEVSINTQFFDEVIGKSYRLQRVKLVNCFLTNSCSLVVESTSIKSFYYIGLYRNYPHFIFRNSPHLIEVKLEYSLALVSSEALIGETLLNLPSLQSLSIDGTFLKKLSIEKQPILINLRDFELVWLFSHGLEVRRFYNLIKKSPNLRKLELQMFPSFEDINIAQVIKEHAYCLELCKNIMEVTLIDFHGLGQEIELVGQFLHYLGTLQKMVLKPSISLCESYRCHLISKIQGYHCSSSTVEIWFGEKRLSL